MDEEIRSPKLAIVCAAGGTSCSYSGGALVALAREQGLRYPDIIIAASGSAGSAIYYLAGQYDSIRRIWTEHICTPSFISFRRIRKILDVDYLVDTIIKKFEPLDLESLSNVRTRYFIPVKHATSGKGMYFSCRDGHDIHELLRATKALPLFYGRKVNIAGEPYLDSIFKITKEHGVSKALELGATHVLVIEINGRRENRLIACVNRIISRISQKGSRRHKSDLESRVLRLQPDFNPAPPITRNPSSLAAAYEKGYSDVRDHPELREFLKPFISSPKA